MHTNKIAEHKMNQNFGKVLSIETTNCYEQNQNNEWICKLVRRRKIAIH